MWIEILSPIMTLPPSSGMLKSMPNSLRLMVGGGLDADAGAAPRVAALAEEVDGELDRLGDALDREVAGDDEVVAAFSTTPVETNVIVG